MYLRSIYQIHGNLDISSRRNARRKLLKMSNTASRSINQCTLCWSVQAIGSLVAIHHSCTGRTCINSLNVLWRQHSCFRPLQNNLSNLLRFFQVRRDLFLSARSQR